MDSVYGGLFQVVSLLLERVDAMEMYDALLLAINFDHDDIALRILKHDTYKQVKDRSPQNCFPVARSDPLGCVQTGSLRPWEVLLVSDSVLPGGGHRGTSGAAFPVEKIYTTRI